MAVITTGGSGNWSSTTNNAPWPGGTVPSSTDTVVVANTHVLTVDTPVSIGSSGATGTAAITINSGGRLNADSNITFAGDLVLQRNARFDVAAGVQLLWDMPSGSNYKIDYQNAGSGGAATININGTANSRVLMKRNSGATGDYVQFNVNVFQPLNLTASYFTMEDCGTSSVAAFTCSGSSQAHNWNFTGFRQINCGQFNISLTSSTLTFNVDGWDVRSPKGTTPVNTLITGSYTSGTRRIQKFTIYDASTTRTCIFTLRSTTFENERTLNAYLNITGSSGRDSTWQDGVITSSLATQDILQNTYANANHIHQRNVYARIINDYNNAHNIEESNGAAVGANKYYDNVCHGGFTTPNDDDGIFPANNTEIYRNIFCAGFGGLNTKNVAGTNTKVKHNTFIHNSTTGHGYGVVVGELNSGITNPDVIDVCEDNIFAVLGAQTAGDLSPGFQLRTSSPQLNLNTGYLRNNAFWYSAGATASAKFTHWHTALGRASYIGNSGASGTNIRVTAFTLAASTSYPTIKSSGLFGSVAVGDMFFIPTKGNARVESVTDSNTIVLDTTTANFSSNPVTGDANCFIQTKLWSGGEKMGADANHGGADVYADPGFVDPDRSLATWDTSLGGPGTELNAIRELVAVNGCAYDGSSVTANASYTQTALLAYLQEGNKPTNSALMAAYDVSMAGGWIGAVEGESASSGANFMFLFQ